MKRLSVVLCAALLTIGFGAAVAFGQNSGYSPADPPYAGQPGPNPDCPDADADGICNGQDPDYTPAHPNCPNPVCPDADGDGICNGQDPDYTPPGLGPHALLYLMLRNRFGLSF